jgi:hypothetical protein
MNDVILFFGTLSLENNGGFAAVRTKPEIIGQPRLDGLDGLQGPEPLELSLLISNMTGSCRNASSTASLHGSAPRRRFQPPSTPVG